MKTFNVKSIQIKKQPVTFPDIDTDFGSGKDDLVNYLVKKYGQDQVAYVGNRLTYAPKSVIRDLGQVYDIPSSETILCTKGYKDSLSVEENMRLNKKIKEFFTKYPQLIDKVDTIVGTVSGLSVHAGGVVITDKKYPLTKFCALQRSSDEGRIATLWTKDELQPIGIVKYDLLGLTTAGQNHVIKQMTAMDPYEPITIEDEEVYRDVVLNNKHRNIFQFETQLGKRAFDDLKPMNFMELANASSILRIVGSEEGRDIYDTYKNYLSYIQMGNKEYWKEQLREEIIEDRVYDVCLKVLQDSYGVLIYQEQVSQLVVELSYRKRTFADGNKARKALEGHNDKYGKLAEIQGDKEALKRWHNAFMVILNDYFLPYLKEDGKLTQDKNLQHFLNFQLDASSNLPTPKYGLIKMLISGTAYLFSKLHAVAYTQNTYDAMYLKHYHPLEFWTGSLIYEQDSLDKVASYLIAIGIETKLKVLPPNVNESNITFGIEKGGIRYGLKAMMNVGEAANLIVHERRQNGRYKSIDDFCSRLTTRALNKRVIEALFYTNAFSDFGDQEQIYNDLVRNGINLGVLVTDINVLSLKETKYLGIALTNIHPLMQQAKAYMPITDMVNGERANIAVHIIDLKSKTTKKNKPYVMFKCQCLNSLETINVFDWDNNSMGFQKGTFEILHVNKNNDFYSLVMKRNYEDLRKRAPKQKFFGNKDMQKKLRDGLKK